jgi:hypothetical protein
MNTEIKKYSKSEILENINSERELLETILAKFTDEQLVTKGIIGEWSIKDILAHITAWEQRLIGWAKIGISGKEPEDFPTNMDEVNAMNVESSSIDKKKTLSVVMQEFSESFPETVKAVEAIPPEMLEDLDYFKWRKAPFWVIVAADTWWHYKEHQEDLEKALESFK